jgi:predicted phosphodiesterase
MPFAFVHLSDIHFGQERGGTVVTHGDAKARLIDDIKIVMEKVKAKRAAGIIVTGDIAYGGKEVEYKEAAKWLDEVARAAGCEITDIQVVPGNHDIDLAEISAGGGFLLSQIAEYGEVKLDEFLSNDRDRATLYARFTSYIPFAEGYNCAMDCAGGLASEKIFPLAPGRELQFVGLNSALVCKKKDEVGKLLLGARQRVLPVQPGRELVVLSHHPLHWLQDSEDARKFVRSRARVLISGHEHTPKVNVEEVEDGCDLMTLAAGATCPPDAVDPYTYTYNVLEFELDAATDQLKVIVHPRAWDDEHKRFDHDAAQLRDNQPAYFLGCPNFRAGARLELAQHISPQEGRQQFEVAPADARVVEQPKDEIVVPDEYPLILLRFFRDLTDGQRLAVLVNLNALPSNWSEESSHAMQRQILDALVKKGRLNEVKAAIENERRKPPIGSPPE